jgi:hypothetical protein
VLTLVFLPAMYAIWFRIAARSGDMRALGRFGSDERAAP